MDIPRHWGAGSYALRFLQRLALLHDNLRGNALCYICGCRSKKNACVREVGVIVIV